MKNTNTLKTIILNKPGEFVRIDRDFNDDLAENEALLKIHRIGICGTDYHAFRGKQPFFSYPRVLGHELGAEVIALGKGVDKNKMDIANLVEMVNRTAVKNYKY
jgi:threonine dehydrogenase-like Zn-dependent dehydrogenase